ncbi:hypothetical protein OKW30_003833 [Paraburkholderia sp. Clong3]|uniref:hypothetical protein n=1 Tax=Paraburkholderia sp. Clong3 TaxID=2991061 RepID=UPI003D235A59
MSIDERRLDYALGEARRLFYRWRSRYGNHATTRFERGQMCEDGQDIGVKLAVEEWAVAFCDVGIRDVDAIADRAEAENPKWPPTLPQFLAAARAVPAAKVALRATEQRIECTPATRESEFEAIRAILKAAAIPKRRPGRPKKENPGQGSLLAGSPEVRG